MFIFQNLSNIILNTMNKEMTYEQAVKTTGTVLIEFYASWCPHCQRMMPVIKQVEDMLSGQVPVYKYDIDIYEADSDAAGVQVVPTFIVYRNTREMWRHSGEITSRELLDAVYTSLQAD